MALPESSDSSARRALSIVSRSSSDATFEAFVRREYRALICHARAYGLDAFSAEEVVAEALARTYGRHRRLEVEQLGSYTRQTILREVIARYRRRTVEHRHLPSRRDDWRIAGDVAVDPTDRVSDSDELLRLVERLPAAHREVLTLRFILDFDEAQTAERLGTASGTVKSRTSRALAALRVLQEAHTGVS